ncbi:MAG: NINE protein [Gammaproteobacteria bacterium]|nr:NINE protein [Gammaproteobacteria bacterium]
MADGTDALYTVSFAGECLPDRTETEVRANLARVLKLDDERIDRLFSGKTVVIKRNVDETGARRFQAAFERSGALCTVSPPLEEYDAGPGTINPGPRTPCSYQPPISRATRKRVVGRRRRRVPMPFFVAPAVRRSARTDRNCPACGVHQIVGSPRSKKVAAILAFLLGFTGLHRFYLGQARGFVHLLFMFFAWPVAVGEGIWFLLTPEAKWQRKYGNVIGPGTGMRVLIGFGMVCVIGSLAAVAVPAYQDYMNKARIAQAMDELDEVKDQIERFHATHQHLPEKGSSSCLPPRRMARLRISGSNPVVCWSQLWTLAAR